MTIRELLTKIKKEKPSPFTDAELVEFVNDVESHVGEWLNMDQEDVPQYTVPATTPAVGSDTGDLDTELLIPTPYDRLYVSYVKAMIDYAREEYPSYQLNQEQFEQDAANAIDWIVRSGQTVDRRQIPYRFKNIF